ncbi:hypothetical protein KC19_11G050500 [Ceratodon purpureus]|uniref:Protein kinase domain-containing protein n=1 Tax=Ceratodon purpureus TaxID=3225 RepID=A0A8T0GDG3_CERPU|nr:hypothetical protein KC19_11G050500 [Ceratodon purpureus]KAG0556394.1 hypothetical protein KC19_11G050500 [Ceratodon purpureus]
MEKVMEPLNWKLYDRRDIMSSGKSRLQSYTVHYVLIYLCLAAVSSPLWCTSSIAQPTQAPTIAPAQPPIQVPLGPTLAPGPAPADPSKNPTDPDQMKTLYSLEIWPDVWRQRGTVPNISDPTIPNRDPCISQWVGIKCNNGTPYQFIYDITVVDVEGDFPKNFLAVMSELLTLTGLKVYQKGDNARSSLGGTLPASLGQLKLLTEINFRGNLLSGSIPPEVAQLPSLQTINLADNHFTGTIDQFCNSTSLQTLLLFDNVFSQDIPPCLGSMSQLVNLNLGANNITGPIPDSFTGLVNLQSLNIDNTTLSGGLSDKLVASWPKLSSLSLRRSTLSGPIPAALGSLSNLTQIMLAQNKFSGTLPPSLGNLTSLTTLGLYENRLTGEIPPEFGGMTNMTLLLLGNNSLSGSIPASLGKLSKLQQLHLEGNNFSGAVDGGLFTSLTDLRGLLLQDNHFNGTFPSHAVFNSCTHLVNVSLSYNEFSGPVLEPNTVLPSNLSFLLMAYNKFSGSIPAAMGGAMSLLRFLDLANNSLTGEVPAEVTTKASTAQINLSFNSLNVTKQTSQPGYGLFNCNPKEVNCTEYHVGSNKEVAINIGGPAHAEYEADIVTPDFSVGMFRKSPTSSWSLSTTGIDGGGLINRTATIFNPDNVDHFVLYNSARTGADSFTYYVHSLMPGTKYTVELGFVELADDIRAGERVFDIWIQGELVYQGMDVMMRAPGQYRAFVEAFEVTTLDSSGLLTIELRGHGSWPLVFNKRFKQGYYRGPILSALKVYQVHQLSKLAKIGIIVGSAAGGLIVAVAVLLLLLFYVRKQRKLQALKDEHSGLGITFFRYSELEAATNKWSEKSLLGEGAFGKVYRGVLQDGTIVAIKQLVTRTDGPFCSKEAFLNEARIISTTRHRNLIALLGCCFETENPMFICEYMPNGSLHDALFVHNLPLNWAQRMSIAKDVASALLYLHEETASRIIHRDVKPANILLDEKMNARVADFGLARLVADQETVDLVTNVMGTRGYLAPEYALNGQLSDKVDVYSYGVVLLELVSGRHGLQPSRDLPEPVPISMVQWAWDMVADDMVLAVADPDLDHGFFNEDFIRVVEISLWCTQSHPHMRPTMNQVLRMLLKQARVPKLVEQRTNYEARDFNLLPINPFDEKEWPSYISETAPAGKGGKGGKEYKEEGSFNTNPSEESFDHTVCPTSGLLAR